MSGLELQQRLAEDGIELPIIFITAHGDVPTCAQAFKAGALDFLEKPLDGKVFLDHVRKALARGAEQKRPGPAAEFAARMNRLTPSEKDVLDMLISGKTLKEIAAVSNVTVQTIWKHRLAIHKKMGVESDVELVRLAAEWAIERARKDRRINNCRFVAFRSAKAASFAERKATLISAPVLSLRDVQPLATGQRGCEEPRFPAGRTAKPGPVRSASIFPPMS